MTENTLLSAVLSLAELFGWRTLHIRPAMTEHGWRSPVQGDGKGFPDVLAIRGDRILAAELKSDQGRLTDEQRAWLDVLAQAGVETHLWRPEHWQDGSIADHLKRSTNPTTEAKP